MSRLRFWKKQASINAKVINKIAWNLDRWLYGKVDSETCLKDLVEVINGTIQP